MANSREMGHLKMELGSVRDREREWRDGCGQLERRVEQLTRENDTLRAQHLAQVSYCNSLQVHTIGQIFDNVYCIL